ncbi:hypothetical protein BJ742DRAFT_414010 [Cladochytrium replicatum]|nr:hypothetical protein BJ742DRAFT_414010 [Cladochytrium replicatum]
MKSQYLSITYTMNCTAFPNIVSKTRKSKIWSREVIVVQPKQFDETLLSQNVPLTLTNRRKYFRTSLLQKLQPGVSYELKLNGGQTYVEGDHLFGSVVLNGTGFHLKDMSISILTYMKFLQRESDFKSNFEYKYNLQSTFIQRHSELLVHHSNNIWKESTELDKFEIVIPNIQSVDSELVKIYSVLQISIVNKWTTRKLVIEAPIIVINKKDANSSSSSVPINQAKLIGPHKILNHCCLILKM